MRLALAFAFAGLAAAQLPWAPERPQQCPVYNGVSQGNPPPDRRLAGSRPTDVWPFGATRLFRGDMCPSTCQVPSAADLADMQSTVANPFSLTKAQLPTQTPPSISTPINLDGFTNTMQLEFDEPTNVYPGLYTMPYQAVDVCQRKTTATARVTYTCNNPPVIVARNMSVTIQEGAEVLIDVSKSYDVDEEDSFDSMTFSFCGMAPASDSRPLTTVFRVDSTQKALYVQPLVSGQPYTVTVLATDGCNIVEETVIVTATISCCNHHPQAAGTQTVQWFEGNAATTKTVDLDGSMSSQHTCLPPGYHAVKPGASTNRFFQTRYSPVVQDVWGRTLTYNNTEVYPRTGATVEGCTWPGAANFNADATVDSGECFCSRDNYQWSFNLDKTKHFPQKTPAEITVSQRALTFYSELAAPTVVTAQNCKHVVQGTALTSSPGGEHDLRVKTDPNVGTTPILDRPSTSWDAFYTWKWLSGTGPTQYYSWVQDTYNTGQTKETCAMTLAAPTNNLPNQQATIEYNAANGKFTDCLGRYSFSLSGVPLAATECPSPTDTLDVSVVCPFPQMVQVLAQESVLWDGVSFVPGGPVAFNPTTREATVPVATGDWVSIDARDTPNQSANNVQYKLTVTQPTAMVSFPGAGPTGALAGVNDLGVPLITYLDTSKPNITASFLPGRNGMYVANLTADDGCNPLSFDTTVVHAECLTVASQAVKGPFTAYSSVGPTAAKQVLVPRMTTNGPNDTVSYGWRITRRPVAPYGEKYPAAGYGTAKYECGIGESWNTQSQTRKLTGRGATTAQLTWKTGGGNPTYEVQSVVTDGCGFDGSVTLPVTNPCGTTVTLPDLSTPINIVYDVGTNGPTGWGKLEPPAATATSGGTVRYGWYLESIPGDDLTNPTKVYAAPTGDETQELACSAYPADIVVGDLFAVDQANRAAPRAENADPTAAAFDVDAVVAGAYKVAVQADDKCSWATAVVTYNTQCNDAARFICVDETNAPVADPVVGSPCAGRSHNYVSGCTNAPCQASFGWDCVAKRFHTSTISGFADGGTPPSTGTDPNAKDTLAYAVTVNAPTKSWLSTSGVTQELTFKMRVTDATGRQSSPSPLLEDANGQFTALETAIRGNIVAAVKAQLGLTDMAPGDVDRVTAGTVSVTAAGCYVPYWGRLFTVTLSFTVLPSKYYGVMGTETSYAAWTDADVRPLGDRSNPAAGTFLAVLNEKVGACTAPGAATCASPLISAIVATVPGEFFTGDPDAMSDGNMAGQTAAYEQSPLLTKAPLAFAAQGTWFTAGKVADSFQPAVTTWTPDIDGTYTWTVSVVDTCPGTTRTPVTRSYTVTVPAASCTAGGSAIPSVAANLTADGTPTSSLNVQWQGRSLVFGTDWEYGGTLTAADYAPLGITSSAVLTCFPSTGPSCGTVAPTATNLGSQAGTSSVVQYRGGTTAAPAGLAGSAGATIHVEVNGASGATAGAELYLGCRAFTTTAFTAADLTSVRFFHVFNQNGAASVDVPIPALCRNTYELVFYQAAVPQSVGAITWTINKVSATAHPTLFFPPPQCMLAYDFKLGSSAVPNGAGEMSPRDLIAIGARRVVIDPEATLASAGTVASLVTSGQQTLSFSAYRKPLPTYLFPANSNANVCPSASTTTGPSINVRCLAMQPQVTNVFPTGSTNVAFQTDRYQYATAELAARLTGADAGKYTAMGILKDLYFQFEMTDAPPTSNFNKQWIYDALVVPEAMKDPMYTPMGGTETKKCYYNYDYSWGSLPAGKNDIVVSPNNTAVRYKFPDPNGVRVFLRSKAEPTFNEWQKAPFKGEGQLTAFRFSQNSTTAFQPDISSSATGQYKVTVTVADGCQTLTSPETPVPVQACTDPTVTIDTIPSQAWDVNGPRRVALSGVVNNVRILTDAPLASRVKAVRWRVMDPNGVEVPVQVDNPKSLYASVTPAMAGTYTVELSADNGCRQTRDVWPTIVTTTFTVDCSAVPTPSPTFRIEQTTNFGRTSVSGQMTVPYLPNAAGFTKDTFNVVGQPNCPSFRMSQWLPAQTTFQSCPAPYSVRVVSVFPPALLAGRFGQLVQITLAVGSASPGIPDGLLDPQYHTFLDDNAVAITVGSAFCSNPVIVDAAAGQLVCRLTHGVMPTAEDGPQRVRAILHGVSSTALDADQWIKFSPPQVVSAAPVASMPTTGGQWVRVSGHNLAFNAIGHIYNRPELSEVYINGKPCTGVKLDTSAAWAPAFFQREGSLLCMAPPGFGVNLMTRVDVAFKWAGLGGMPDELITAQANVFSYDAPRVTALTVASGAAEGGYMTVATVANLGAKYYNASGMPTQSFASGQPFMDPYATLAVMVGDSMVDASTIKVLTDETATAAATVQFMVPGGCSPGAGARVMVKREGAMTMPSQSTALFVYDAPQLICVGTPYKDATLTGCTRVNMDGLNLAAPGTGRYVNVTFINPSTGEQSRCDDVQTDTSSAFNRINCRLPSTAKPGDSIVITNKCGQNNLGASGRRLAGLAATQPTLPSAIQQASCASEYVVSDSQSFDAAGEPPLVPNAESVQAGQDVITFVPGGSWRERGVSNGLFLGIAFPLLLIIVLAYPLYVFCSKRNAGGPVRAFSKSTPASAPTSSAAPTAGRSRVTMNPVSSRGGSSPAAAPSSSRQPAPAPPGTHDEL